MIITIHGVQSLKNLKLNINKCYKKQCNNYNNSLRNCQLLKYQIFQVAKLQRKLIKRKMLVQIDYNNYKKLKNYNKLLMYLMIIIK
jgi:hypothetical protein